jgi:hypothetical protein
MSRDAPGIAFQLLHTSSLPSKSTTNRGTAAIMHFTKIVTSILLVATASASPLGSRNIALGKREDSDGQAGAYINAGTDVAFAFVYGSTTCPDITYMSHHHCLL